MSDGYASRLHKPDLSAVPDRGDEWEIDHTIGSGRLDEPLPIHVDSQRQAVDKRALDIVVDQQSHDGVLTQ